MLGACPFPVPQGSQVFLQDTVRSLQNAGHEVHIVVYGYGLGESPPDLHVHRCRDFFARKTDAGPSLLKPVLDVSLGMTLRRVVKTYSIECVLAHNYEALITAWASGVRPIVYQAHNAMSDELPHYFGNNAWAGIAGTMLDRVFPQKAQHVVVPHEPLKAYLCKCGCVPDMVSVSPPPAPLDAFGPALYSDDQPFVVYTGNLDAYQNLPFLEKVAGLARTALPGLRFVFATGAPKAPSWAEYRHTPDFGSLKSILTRDCIVVCPRVSWSGYPIKLLNAMAAGRPIVACHGSAHPLVHGENALLAPDDDADTFATHVIELAQSRARRECLGQAARATAENSHNPVDFARMIASTCEAAVRKPVTRMV